MVIIVEITRASKMLPFFNFTISDRGSPSTQGQEMQSIKFVVSPLKSYK